MDPQLTLASALSKARLKETVWQQQLCLWLEGVHSGSTPNQDQCASVDAVSHRKQPQQSQERRFYYYGDAHMRSVCPAKFSKCHNYGNKGHFAKACLKTGRPTQRRYASLLSSPTRGTLLLVRLTQKGKRVTRRL